MIVPRFQCAAALHVISDVRLQTEVFFHPSTSISGLWFVVSMVDCDFLFIIWCCMRNEETQYRWWVGSVHILCGESVVTRY